MQIHRRVLRGEHEGIRGRQGVVSVKLVDTSRLTTVAQQTLDKLRTHHVRFNAFEDRFVTLLTGAVRFLVSITHQNMIVEASGRRGHGTLCSVGFLDDPWWTIFDAGLRCLVYSFLLLRQSILQRGCLVRSAI